MPMTLDIIALTAPQGEAARTLLEPGEICLAVGLFSAVGSGSVGA
jgi:hypothetical protein